ncbi:MAG TPA: FUSC family protein, partial [Roseiarcus sp.]|nr:FUSC family protein [Roseiarcus sp.]
MNNGEAIGKAERGLPFARLSSRAVGPLLFGLRLWASVCLALYAAFALQLSEPSWAGTTAALVCQPQLGASLRKGSFRLIGTAVGGFAIVIIAAAFPQNRVGFLGALALWAAACGFAGALLKNFAAYAAGLAGFTAGVIAIDILGPSGGANDKVVTFALFRVVEISVGIVSAGVVLALTDLGHARRRLGVEFASIAATALAGFAGAASDADPDEPASRALRRETMRRVIALDPMIDTAIGEASDLRYRSGILQGAVNGLIETISAWRTLAIHLGRRSRSVEAPDAAPIERVVRGLPATAEEIFRHPAALRDACAAAARAAARIPCESPSSQLLADAASIGLIGMARALNGLTLIVDPARTRREDALASVYVPDWLPPSIVAARAFATTVLVSLFWIATAWSSGPFAITFAIIVAVLLPLQGDRAYSSAMSFLIGCVLSAAIAAFILFGVLPGVDSFLGLALALGLALVPL